MDIDVLLSQIPDYSSFLTMDEMDANSLKLAKEFPDSVEVFSIGRSRRGHPILCLKIGEGSKNVLFFGSPHPNEPVGSMMLEFLTRRIAENKELSDELDLTWYCIKSVDPDGTRLNEGWFKGPFNIWNYARNFFRPAGFEQVEWTFPFTYKTYAFDRVLPETQSLASLISRIKPIFIYSLHNAAFGGVYWYISHDIPNVYPKLWHIVEQMGLPLALGEPEVPYAERFSKAVYRQLSIIDEYEYIFEFEKRDPAEVIKTGANSFDYAKSVCDPFTLVCEVPYFFIEDISNTDASDMLRSEAVLASCDIAEEFKRFCRSNLEEIEEYSSPDNPFFTAVKAFSEADSEIQAKRVWAMSSPECKRFATVAEKFSSLYCTRFYNMLTVAMLMRGAMYELDKGISFTKREEALSKVRDVSFRKVKDTCRFLEQSLNYRVVPIKKLITIQLASALYFLEDMFGNN